MDKKATPTQICALVPVKRLEQAKSRLAPRLTAHQRAGLAEAMLRDVLEVLSSVSQLAGLAVITSDAAVAAIAKDYGAIVIGDLDNAGINNAVRCGQKKLAEAGYTGVLVVPADIPFLNAQEIETALSALAKCDVLITPANRDGGTNLLGLSPPTAMEPSFGLHSFRRHRAMAQATGLEVAVLPLEGAGHDVDLPADLWLVPSRGPAARTRRLLSQLGQNITPASPGIIQETSSPWTTSRC
ncbi:2-phospho-L-lactate guanylyltransferase [Labrys sp. KNU-23]|uniref:2-phospho-L-lactate guanylyltransferase n=1 Tax=Labrys sp. KNU-23 TaxID=2789216 RepID=UPI0011EF6EBF|nr:2-phospho-L-lactate guanylyltransferase [Labrys sp. KNU-23]QEN86033.1 2-phospho-L-lactate guanylyltransferase [Labrys sp. KNU-23]